MALKNYEFWFVVGSQFLYGPEVLETVAGSTITSHCGPNTLGVLFIRSK